MVPPRRVVVVGALARDQSRHRCHLDYNSLVSSIDPVTSAATPPPSDHLTSTHGSHTVLEAVTCGPIVAGGDSLVRRSNEKVLFVEGGIPGEVVDVAVTTERKDLRRGHVVHIAERSPARVEPPCPVFRAGCGGCQWQHIDSHEQHNLKVGIVVDALRRIAKIDEPDVQWGDAVQPFSYRTTMRLRVVDGRVALNHRRSNEAVTLDTCLIAHPLLQELIIDGRYGSASEVTLRVGAATGERLAWVRGADDACHLPDDVVITRNGRKATIHEDVHESRFRISARSFFQSGPEAAELVTRVVDEAVPDDIDVLLDAYAGVGVLGGVVARKRDCRLIAIEQDGSSLNDAKVNLDDLDARLVLGEVAAVRPADLPQPDVIIADPARPGLGPSATRALTSLEADRIVLVSCDPASLARDVTLLHGRGYKMQSTTVLDLFPQTHHVETVTTFDRV